MKYEIFLWLSIPLIKVLSSWMDFLIMEEWKIEM